MLALKIEAFAAVRHGPDQYRLVWAEIIARIALVQLFVKVSMNWPKIEHRGREVRDGSSLLARDIPDHRQRLQVNLGPHNGRSKAEHAAALQPLHSVREDQKVAIAGIAVSRAVAVAMLMC